MKRLEKQFANVSTVNPEQISAKQKQNLFHWEVCIKGPTGTPYEGHDLLVDFDFPQQFPFKFPMIRFKTPIWHPNVKDGDICKQMVGQKQWQPNKKVAQIIQSLQSMLIQPDLHSAINLQAAKEYKQGKFEAHARQVLKQKKSDQKHQKSQKPDHKQNKQQHKQQQHKPEQKKQQKKPQTPAHH